ncbi:hypothetical protein [Actinacidiphila oryziradicis]|nr:hypothetical protein [Actinacidiphila oryziradicis]
MGGGAYREGRRTCWRPVVLNVVRNMLRGEGLRPLRDAVEDEVDEV